LKTVRVQDAVGMILGHDLTRVVPGEIKGVAFKKGHVIAREDIPMLLSMGKDHIYVWEIGGDELHENEAAKELALALSGSNVTLTEPSEAKVNVTAKSHGVLKINRNLLTQVNEMPGVAVATLHSDIIVTEGELVASIKVIPLTLPRDTILAVQQICRDKTVIDVVPLSHRKVGMVITGNEVYYGRIQDKFAPVIRAKLAALQAELTETIFVPDDPEQIRAAIQELIDVNDMVVVSGGMSVDPDDVTPEGIRWTGASMEVYGTPVLPGAMFLMAYLDGKPVMGIPACGMFCKTTILDGVLPKTLIGEPITRQYIASLGYGGLCRNCADGCRYPACSFAK
jgi:molybdenum cofactor synthesis domain-containing protein